MSGAEVDQAIRSLQERIDLLTARLAESPALPDHVNEIIEELSQSLDRIAERWQASQRRHSEDLARAGRHKQTWLAMLAHELRNPLTPIRNAVHVLRLRGSDDKTRNWAADLLERQVHQLARLIDDLLDVSRINRGKIELHRERLDLADVVRSAVDDYRKEFETAGLNLQLFVPPERYCVFGDATRLTQVFGGLLQNALKFTPVGGTVSVRLQGHPLSGRAEVSIQDTGVGIEPSQLPKLFGSFVQADQNLARSRGGLGLGLALAKGLVELHSGNIRVASDGSGKGACFTLTLPLQTANEEHLQSSEPPPIAAQPLRLLVVDDNHDAADSLKRMLELMGHEVRVVYSGPSAIEAARLFLPDAVLCDLGLPGLDGFQVARRLRADAATADLRLIALSAYGSEADRGRSREAGFDTHLTKPVNPHELEHLLTGLPRGSLGSR